MFYRPLVSYYLNRKVDSTTIIEGQREYAGEVFERIEPHLPKKEGVLKLLDIGGSTGVVAKVIKDRLETIGFRVEATVIDPSPDELAVAEKLGLKTIEGLVEEKNIRERTFGSIIMFSGFLLIILSSR